MSSNNEFLQLGNSAGKILNTKELKGGIKREDFPEELLPVFDAFNNGNKILTSEAVNNIKSCILSAANPNENKNKNASVFSDKEAKNFIAKNEKLKDISVSNLFEFLEIIETKSKNVISSADENNITTTTYNENGNIIRETYDNTTNITERTVSADNETHITKTKDDIKLSETIINNDLGESATTKYSADGSIISKTRQIKDQNNTTITTDYENNQPSKEYVTTNTTEQEFIFDDNNKKQLIKSTDKNTNTITSIDYTETGKTETIKTPESTTINEYNSDEKLVKQTETSGNRKISTTYDYKNNKITTLYSVNNKNMSQEVSIDNRKYVVYYDGIGHTKGVTVQYKETIGEIAKKFNCDIEKLTEANKHSLHGKSPNYYFLAGANIVIPYEMDADKYAKINSGRHSSEYVLRQTESEALKVAAKNVEEKQKANITLAKDYENFEKLAIDLLNKQGVKNPSQQQINKMRNTLKALNPNINNLKNGASIKVIKTETYTKEKTSNLSNNQKKIIQIYSYSLNPSEQIRFNKLTPDEKYQEATQKLKELYNDSKNIARTDAIKVGGATPTKEFLKTKLETDNDIKQLSKRVETLTEQYRNESYETRKLKKDFILYLRQNLKQAQTDLEDYAKKYGWTANAADLISHLWNNDVIPILKEFNTGNTLEQIYELLNKQADFIDELSNYDNSTNGIKQNKDFNTLFKKHYGTDFNSEKIQNFIDVKKEFLEKESIIGTYKYIHSQLDNAIKEFDNASKTLESTKEYNKTVTLINSKYPSVDIEYRDDSDETYKKHTASENLFKLFNSLTGITKSDWQNMLKEAESRNIDEKEALYNFAKIIKACTDETTKKSLGITNLNDIDVYESNLKHKYNFIKKEAIGNSDIVDAIEKYNNSQAVGSAVVSGATQMLIYAVALANPSLLGLTGASSGFISGSAYAASYLIVDTTDRATNKIDNSLDLYSKEAIKNIGLNTGIEFVAGYLFDGILKSKYFGKYENGALDVFNASKAKNAEIIAEKALNNSGTTFTKSKIVSEIAQNNPGITYSKSKVKDLLRLHGTAGVIGGSKDGIKETFKEAFTGKFYKNDIITAFVVGAISNFCLIRFKTSKLAQRDHKIIGKFAEKGHKKSEKQAIKYSDSIQSVDKEEQQYIADFLRDMRTSLKEQAKNNPLILSYIENNPDEIDELAIEYIHYFINSEEMQKNM